MAGITSFWHQQKSDGSSSDHPFIAEILPADTGNRGMLPQKPLLNASHFSRNRANGVIPPGFFHGVVKAFSGTLYHPASRIQLYPYGFRVTVGHYNY
jgi:hypothetical protein